MDDKDIVERLRERALEQYEFNDHELLREAADTIEFLRKQSRGHFNALTAVVIK